MIGLSTFVFFRSFLHFISGVRVDGSKPRTEKKNWASADYDRYVRDVMSHFCRSVSNVRKSLSNHDEALRLLELRCTHPDSNEFHICWQQLLRRRQRMNNGDAAGLRTRGDPRWSTRTGLLMQISMYFCAWISRRLERFSRSLVFRFLIFPSLSNIRVHTHTPPLRFARLTASADCVYVTLADTPSV